MKRTMNAGAVVKSVCLAVGAFFMLIPFLWMLSTAFKTPAELNIWPPKFLPNTLAWDNFVGVFKAAPFELYFLNSLLMAAISASCIVLTSTVAGYIFAKFRFFGRDALFALILATAIVPFEIYMIPLYLQMRALDLVNTFLGLVMPYFIMSFGIFFMRQNIMQQIPDEIIESARVEGASEWRTLFQVVMPLCAPPMSALGIFAFIEAWNSFVWPLLVVNVKELYTMELGLAMFQSSFGIDISVVSAGSLISITPILLVFIFLRRRILDSISRTGLK
ncbi:MAG TPA: carbohydrate ABC transporter permease [Bacilli bacterium]